MRKQFDIEKKLLYDIIDMQNNEFESIIHYLLFFRLRFLFSAVIHFHSSICFFILFQRLSLYLNVENVKNFQNCVIIIVIVALFRAF